MPNLKNPMCILSWFPRHIWGILKPGCPVAAAREAAGEALPSAMLSALSLLILAALPAGTDLCLKREITPRACFAFVSLPSTPTPLSQLVPQKEPVGDLSMVWFANSICLVGCEPLLCWFYLWTRAPPCPAGACRAPF